MTIVYMEIQIFLLLAVSSCYVSGFRKGNCSSHSDNKHFLDGCHRTVSVQIETNLELFNPPLPQLSGSFLKDTYVFENIHYHWGKENYFGSEHFINGESFSLETHMVTFKKSYGDINNALKYKDGVVVLTFFAKEGERNKKFDNFLQYIPKISTGNCSVKVPTLDVILWFLPELIESNRFSNYFAYPGSLTTPPFTESVTFIIIPEPVTVSHVQLDSLRKLKNDETQPVKTNRRELQPLRGRPLISANIIKWNIKMNRSRRNKEIKLSNTKRIED
ncbi:carbonic anhydrase 1-like isoform X2 [Lycorma delicatula]|uniref:carbonic anhydrase 1-like isoform X2 n=1 Tax=Lycorma delicatula TaxID=130591 RepID=UPI003F50F653